MIPPRIRDVVRAAYMQRVHAIVASIRADIESGVIVSAEDLVNRVGEEVEAALPYTDDERDALHASHNRFKAAAIMGADLSVIAYEAMRLDIRELLE